MILPEPTKGGQCHVSRKRIARLRHRLDRARDALKPLVPLIHDSVHDSVHGSVLSSVRFALGRIRAELYDIEIGTLR
jgi:hypothetical protein